MDVSVSDRDWLMRLSSSSARGGVPGLAWCRRGCRDEGGDLVTGGAGFLPESVALGQVGLGLDAELAGALVKFPGEVDGQGAAASKRGEGWREVGQVDGDDAPVEVGVETAAAVREVAGEGGELSGAAPVGDGAGELVGDDG